MDVTFRMIECEHWLRICDQRKHDVFGGSGGSWEGKE